MLLNESKYINIQLFVQYVQLFTLSEPVSHSRDVELCSSFLGSVKHPLDVLGVVSIQAGFCQEGDPRCFTVLVNTRQN